MTIERKQELTQLLQEALANLEIRDSKQEILHIDKYRERLLQYWSSYSLSQSIDFWQILEGFGPHIAGETTQSKLLDFIREAFEDEIHEDRIQSASCRALVSVDTRGYPLDSLLKQLLNIAIGRGVEKAVSAFVKCTESESASFQYRIILVGIKVDAEIQVSDDIGIKPIPPPISAHLSHRMESDGISSSSLGAQLIIDASVSPIFQKPSTESISKPFRVEINSRKFQNADFLSFGITFCHALSLVCNSLVQPYLLSGLMGRDELFNLGGPISSLTYAFPEMSGIPAQVGESQIAETAQLCEILANPSSEIGRKLQIPIDRWIKSKTDQEPIDKVIDLGIAFEALYLPKSNRDQLALQLRLSVAWHLGEDKQHRKRLVDEVKKIYSLRSKAVHTGTVDGKCEKERIATSELILRAQDLCRDSIMKILKEKICKDKKFPDWNDLILGE